MKLDDPRLPLHAKDDPFRPPLMSRVVRCLHCGRAYDAHEMRWDEDAGTWCCAFPDCDGAGYGWDVLDDLEGCR